MRVEINGSKIEFINKEKDEVLMYIDYPCDECIWNFTDSNPITIKEDMELYQALEKLMNEEYEFYNHDELKNSKTKDKLVWYSDCYYEPDKHWSKDQVSYLTITHKDNTFILKCTKPLYEKRKIANTFHTIVFSPLGNGKYSRNTKSTCLTLQDDFVKYVYNELLKKERAKVLRKN